MGECWKGDVSVMIRDTDNIKKREIVFAQFIKEIHENGHTFYYPVIRDKYGHYKYNVNGYEYTYCGNSECEWCNVK